MSESRDTSAVIDINIRAQHFGRLPTGEGSEAGPAVTDIGVCLTTRTHTHTDTRAHTHTHTHTQCGIRPNIGRQDPQETVSRPLAMLIRNETAAVGSTRCKQKNFSLTLQTKILWHHETGSRGKGSVCVFFSPKHARVVMKGGENEKGIKQAKQQINN